MNRGPQIFLWKTPYRLQNEVAPLLSGLPDADKTQAAKLTRPGRHIEFVCGRYLLRKVFSERFQVELPDQFETQNNKPRAQRVFPFNLSHSKKMVSFIVSDRHEIGLDIETENKGRDVLKIAETYGNEDEVSLLNALESSSRTSAFYKLWSLKESFAKATGNGLEPSLKNLKFNFEKTQILETPQKEKCVIFHSVKNDTHISVSVLAEDAPAPTMWEVEPVEDGFRYKKLEDVHFEKFVLVVPGIAANH